MKKWVIGGLAVAVGLGVWWAQPARAHIQENNGKYLYWDGKAVACGGVGEDCYWSQPTTVDPEG